MPRPRRCPSEACCWPKRVAEARRSPSPPSNPKAAVGDREHDQVEDPEEEAKADRVEVARRAFSPGCFRIAKRSSWSASRGERIQQRFVLVNADVGPHR